MGPKLAFGIGLTNACDLACAHCYRDTGTDALSIESVLAAVSAVPTGAVNFGTGENGLHPDFATIVNQLADRGIAVTMTTNGYSAKVLDDATLARFRDVEFSIDFPTKEAHDEARGGGNWDLIADQMARCQRLGVSATIISVIMATNVRALPDLLALAGSRGAFLRVNVYQAVRGDLFSLSYDQFWEAFRLLLEAGDLVTCGEPVVRAALGIPKTPGAGCGATTIRLTPRGAVVPCVYGKDAALTLPDLVDRGEAILASDAFTKLAELPAACTSCPQRETCGGGCPSRRVLRGGLGTRDVYCPFAKGTAPRLSLQTASVGRVLPKAASACTTILRSRSPISTRDD